MLLWSVCPVVFRLIAQKHFVITFLHFVVPMVPVRALLTNQSAWFPFDDDGLRVASGPFCILDGILYRKEIPRSRWLLGTALVTLPLAGFYAGWLDFWMLTAGAYCLFWLATSFPNPLRRVGIQGDFSYGTYVYAFPVQQCLVYFAGGSMPPGINIALAIPLSISLGALSWHLVEKRALAFKSVSLKTTSQTS